MYWNNTFSFNLHGKSQQFKDLLIINDTTGEIMCLTNFNAFLGYVVRSPDLFFVCFIIFFFSIAEKNLWNTINEVSNRVDLLNNLHKNWNWSYFTDPYKNMSLIYLLYQSYFHKWLPVSVTKARLPLMIGRFANVSYILRFFICFFVIHNYAML